MNAITETVSCNLDAALACARAGYRVLRVYGVNDDGTCRCRKGRECGTPGKHPVGTTGVHEATTDEATIRKWFADRPDYNVAIATGCESGLAVVDVDPRHGGKESLDELKGKLTEEQAQQLSSVIQFTGGGGQHLIFVTQVERYGTRLVSCRESTSEATADSSLSLPAFTPVDAVMSGSVIVGCQTRTR